MFLSQLKEDENHNVSIDSSKSEFVVSPAEMKTNCFFSDRSFSSIPTERKRVSSGGSTIDEVLEAAGHSSTLYHQTPSRPLVLTNYPH